MLNLSYSLIIKRVIQMKALSILLVLAGTLLISACDGEPQKPKIKNPLAGHVEALEKAKAVEKQLHDSLKKKMDAVDSMK